MVINNEGIPLKSTLDSSTTVQVKCAAITFQVRFNKIIIQYGGMVSDLAETARSIVRDLDPTNQLTFLRVKSVKHEVNQGFRIKCG